MPPDIAPADEAANALDRYLRRAVPFGFSGAVLLATDDEVRLARGYGMADPAAGRPNRASTVFSLGSITKPLTATLVLTLVDEGRIGLADPAGRWLDGVPRAHADVTIERLLTHTAGLPDATGDDFDPGARGDVLAEIFRLPPRFPPGSAYAYSNTGYSVLAAIVEEVTGEPFEAALRRRLLDPAGMTATGYRLPAWDRSDLAHFFVGDTDVGVHVDKEFPSWHVMGNGEMLSTVGDLHRLTRALAAGSLLRRSTLEDAFTPRRGQYGLGWSITDGPHGPVAGHDGASTNGVSALLRWFREPDTIIAVLCNRDYFGGFLVHAVGPHVESLAFGEDAPMPPDVPGDTPDQIADPTGTYVTDAGGRVVVRRALAGYVASFTGQDVLDLVGGQTSGMSGADADRSSSTLEMIRRLVAGEDRPLLDELDNDRERLERYRSFATDRLGTDPTAIDLDGSLPAELSNGPALAVQLSVPGDDAEGTLRIFWRDGRPAGLGYGTRPLLALPLVPIGPDRFVLHHLALGTTIELAVAEDGALVMARSAGTILARPAP